MKISDASPLCRDSLFTSFLLVCDCLRHLHKLRTHKILHIYIYMDMGQLAEI